MKRILSSALLVLAVLGGAPADEPPVHDIVVALFVSGGRSPLQGFIGNGLVLELSRNGFRATLLEVNAPAPPAEDRQALAGLARGSSTPLVLAAAYLVRGSEIELMLSAVESQGARLLSTTRRTARVDLTLDQMLISAVKDVVPSMMAVRDRNRERFPPKPAATVAGAQTGAAAVAPSDGPAGPGAPGDATLPAALEPGRVPSRPPRGVEIAVGAAALVPAGDLAAFLNTGISAGVHAELQWRRGDSFVGVGLGTGATVFRAEGPLGSAGGLLAPLVVEGRYGSESANGTGFYLRGGAGAALFVVDSDNAGLLRKLVPCATASLGLSRRLSDLLGLALDLNYAVYLDSGDSSDLIMGLAPGLQLFFSR